MELPHEAYKEFQRLYEKNYGISIPLEEAKIMANQYFNLLNSVYTEVAKNYHEAREK